MFLIAGISPKTKLVDPTPRRCPVCGLYQAHLKRTDHYFSLFFIPLIKVREGQPFLVCDRCEHASGLSFDASKTEQTFSASTCKHCGQPLKKEFHYCPFCGRPV